MSTSKADEIRAIADTFENLDIYPIEIALQHGEAYDPIVNVRPKTFSRFTWSNDEHTVFGNDDRNSNPQQRFLIRFLLNTYTTIGLGGSVPQGEEIPANKIVGTIAIKFAAEYTTKEDPRSIDGQILSIIERAKIIEDVWPYWREALQNLALRARLPTPVLPAKRRALIPVVRDAVQPKKPTAKKRRKNTSDKTDPS